MTKAQGLERELRREWHDAVESIERTGEEIVAVEVSEVHCASIAEWLIGTQDYRIGAMTVRDEGRRWSIHYHFYSRRVSGPWVSLTVSTDSRDPHVVSLSGRIHSLDWLEREAEDHFGIRFEGHPRLGDFVLHDERWQEELAPMRKDFDGRNTAIERRPNVDWKPRRLLHTQGAFSMTVGPIHGGTAEPVHFLLESVGEEIIRAYPRLFYKFRAVEKLAEGREPESALLLAERFDALHAFAHSLAFCGAVERLRGVEVSPRARRLRILLAEMERLRSHIASIRGICASTGLAVAESQAAILEEQMLRVCGTLTGHRYLFGLNVVGGLSVDLSDRACRKALGSVFEVRQALERLRDMLANSSSFLDRLEEVGVVPLASAIEHGLVGPVARASGYEGDLRVSNPYGGYEAYEFEQASESEGDGYSRLRVLFFEALQSTEICRQCVEHQVDERVVPSATVGRGPKVDGARSAFGWVEAPGGAAFHALWTDDEGRIERYRIVPPSFFNWHGLHAACEGFAFQDFPIILATFALSVAENDR